MSSINLNKGSSINLTKEVPGLKKVYVSISWDEAKKGADYDADLSVIGLSAGKIQKQEDVVYYNHKSNPDGTIKSAGDNLTGAGDTDTDKETITIDLAKIRPSLDELQVVMTLYQAKERKEDLSQLTHAYCRIVDASTDKEIAKFQIDGAGIKGDTLHFGNLVKDTTGAWHFNAVGTSDSEGLMGMMDKYGFDAATPLPKAA